MDKVESARTLNGAAFEQFAMSLFDGDASDIQAVIAALTFGTHDDFERIAAILSFAPIGSYNVDYYSTRYASSADKRYVDLFINICAAAGIAESDYIKVMLAAGVAKRGGALWRWNPAVDAYLKQRSREDFALVADYIDRYDKKYTKYGALIEADCRAALERLVGMLLYSKNFDKTAVRDILMDHTELAKPLMGLYERSHARERAAIARLLLLYKNDTEVAEFLENTVAADKSKTVQQVLRKKNRKKYANPAEFMENAMAEGDTYTASEWAELFSDKGISDIADRTFFVQKTDDGPRVLLYDKGRFLDMSDKPAKFDDGAKIGVMHPLDLPDNHEVFSLRVEQPFEQLRRPVYNPVGSDAYFSDILNGTIVSIADFDGAVKRLGFSLCGKRTAGERDTVVRFVGEYAVCIEFERSEASDTVSCGRVYYCKKSSVVKLNRVYYVAAAMPLHISAVPRREYSELTYAAHRLFSR